jgi:signal transduction histidine kinase
MAIPSRPTRSRPIRLTLIGMFAVPLISLIVLWGFAAGVTVRSAIIDHNYNTTSRRIDLPVEALSADLATERAQSYVWLITERATPETAVQASRVQTNGAVKASLAALDSVRHWLNPAAGSSLEALTAQLDSLGKIRSQVDSGALSASAAFQAYNTILDAQYHFFDTAVQVNDSGLFQASIASIETANSVEIFGREVGLVGGALAARGQMSAADRQLFATTVANRRLLLGDALVMLAPNLRATFAPPNSSANYQQLEAMENQISASAGSSGPIPVNPQAWETASGAYLAAMEKAETIDGVQLSQISGALANRLVTEAVLAGGAGLVAVVASVFLLIWFGRRVNGDLTRLHDDVRGMADERLPRVVERLRLGEDVDVAAESPVPAPGKITEIVRVAEAFSTVQAAAVEATVDQARLRKGINQVFLNLSMRNQSLLHRQLALLDAMERRTNEPEALDDLFRLDHLTTRMRRHAEGLIILSGATPGRGWRDPVPVVDVLRAAVAEVEDYVRVDVVSESRDFVASVAVNDVIHLVAELVENATAFSPPNTRIEVRADRVGSGLVAEIEDRGLGLAPEELAAINQRLASPPEFDLSHSDQLGLFVVGQLAIRHGIKVSLRASPYGGIIAIILMPYGVIVREEDSATLAAPGDRQLGSGRAIGMLPPPDVAVAPAVLGALPSTTRASDDRNRPSVFGLTGRHRLAAVTAAETTVVETRPTETRPEPPAPVRPSRAPWEMSTPDTPWAPVSAEAGPAPAVPWPPAPAEARPPSGPASGDRHLGMPIRVPQANLAPQLRDRPERGTGAGPRPNPGWDERPPETTRNIFMSMQQGWQRGRQDDLEGDDDAPGKGTDR